MNLIGKPHHEPENKEKGNDQKLIQSNSTAHPQNQKGKNDTHKN